MTSGEGGQCRKHWASSHTLLPSRRSGLWKRSQTPRPGGRTSVSVPHRLPNADGLAGGSTGTRVPSAPPSVNGGQHGSDAVLHKCRREVRVETGEASCLQRSAQQISAQKPGGRLGSKKCHLGAEKEDT